MADTNRSQHKTTPGPEPERLKIEGDWKDAVKKALKKRPAKKEAPVQNKGQRGK